MTFSLGGCWETWFICCALPCVILTRYVKSGKLWPLFLWAISLGSVSNKWLGGMKWNHPETKGKLPSLSLKATDFSSSVTLFCSATYCMYTHHQVPFVSPHGVWMEWGADRNRHVSLATVVHLIPKCPVPSAGTCETVAGKLVSLKVRQNLA